MQFNSFVFAIFFIIFFVLYWFVFNKNLFRQNLLLVFASYIFYGWWDYRFLVLIFLSSCIDYTLGKVICRHRENEKIKRGSLYVSLCFNVGILLLFKYYNFFVESFCQLFSIESHNIFLINIILPIGISFYTFQTLSYTIDVYRGRIKPTQSLLDYLVYVSFFPQLVAGPIERASRLIPQIQRTRKFEIEKAKDGLGLVLIGLIKKIVIADAFAASVNGVFENYSDLDCGSLIIASILFSFQIYCDFSGYSDIARGIAKLMGFELMINFNCPYFSRSINEFWKRWHISLSSWFRDYIYIPIGGSRVKRIKAIRNIFIVFLVSGLWHGANSTFLVWGLIHACLFIPSKYTLISTVIERFRSSNKLSNYVFSIISVMCVFMLVSLAWIFFRSESLDDASNYLGKILSFSDGKPYFTILNMGLAALSNLIMAVGVLVLLLLFEYQIYKGNKINWNPIKISFCVIIIILFGQFLEDNLFIYFQF